MSKQKSRTRDVYCLEAIVFMALRFGERARIV
jgi:hypothetical protein